MEDIKNHKFFNGVNWDDVLEKKMEVIKPTRLRYTNQLDPEDGFEIDKCYNYNQKLQSSDLV